MSASQQRPDELSHPAAGDHTRYSSPLPAVPSAPRDRQPAAEGAVDATRHGDQLADPDTTRYGRPGPEAGPDTTRYSTWPADLDATLLPPPATPPLPGMGEHLPRPFGRYELLTPRRAAVAYQRSTMR